MQIPLDEIIVKQRVRIDPGDLEPLMTSMEQHGLMHPVTVNREKVLVAGYRRLEAARRLGWSTIRVHMIDGRDAVSLLEMEIDENRVRKDFTVQELDEAFTSAPAESETFNQIAILLESLGDEDDAIVAAERAVALGGTADPKTPMTEDQAKLAAFCQALMMSAEFRTVH